MELVLIVVLVVLVLAGAGLVVTRQRREPTYEATPPSPPVAAPPTPTEEAEVVEAPPAKTAPAVEVPPVEEAPPAAPPVRPRFRDRLGKARGAVSGYLGAVLSREKVDQETWDDLEEALVVADVGITATTDILERLRKTADEQSITDPEILLEALKAQLKADLAGGDRSLRHEPGAPNVWLFVGVNGVGKTTTIGKVGRHQADEGRHIVMAAGDTFRAAAAEQLETWAERAGADLVRGAEGGDPSSVIFDAVQRAAARGADLVLADTAGRLHTKTNLMDELRKVRRVADREPGRVTEVLLVLDATTGQNGLVQAQQFTEAVDLTGVVLTKLDGSAKGGIALAIQSSLGIPIKLVGLGEGVEDLVEFEPDEFVDALFATD
jgi:fused signal recognition particle receptor